MARSLTEAEKLLVKQHYFTVYRAVYLYCRDKFQAEDAVQEGFYCALKNIGKLKNSDRFAAWVTAIAINELKKQYRKETEAIMLGSNALNDSSYYLEKFDEIETKEDLAQVLDSLEEPYRQVVILYYYMDVSLRDMAEMLHVPNGTVKSRLYHARKKIRRIMGAGKNMVQGARNG